MVKASTLEEIDDNQIDEHYTEFFNVMKFLNTDVEHKKFKKIWHNYSIKLREFSHDNIAILNAKKEAENALYNKICRTERDSAIENTDIIDTTYVDDIEITDGDIISYISLEKLLQKTGAKYHAPIDYVKSTPYLMSFMHDYQLKLNVEKYFKNNVDDIGKETSLHWKKLWINGNAIKAYEKIDYANARLQKIADLAFEKNLFWLLHQ